MPSNADNTEPSPAPEESGQPAPKAKAGRELVASFRLPQWFYEKVPGSPVTDEERAALTAWFDEQLRQRPLTPDDFAPPDEPTAPPDKPGP